MAASLEAKGAGMLGLMDEQRPGPAVHVSATPSLYPPSPSLPSFGVSAALGLSCLLVDWFLAALGTAYRFVPYLPFGLRNTEGPQGFPRSKTSSPPPPGKEADK